MINKDALIDVSYHCTLQSGYQSVQIIRSCNLICTMRTHRYSNDLRTKLQRQVHDLYFLFRSFLNVNDLRESGLAINYLTRTNRFPVFLAGKEPKLVITAEPVCCCVYNYAMKRGISYEGRNTAGLIDVRRSFKTKSRSNIST